jgi:hypothetical protein
MFNTEKLSQLRTAIASRMFNLACNIFGELDTNVQELFDILVEPAPPGREAVSIKMGRVLTDLAVCYKDQWEKNPPPLIDYAVDSIVRDIDRIVGEVTETEEDDDDDVVEGEEAEEDEFEDTFEETEWDPEDDEELDMLDDDEDDDDDEDEKL